MNRELTAESPDFILVAWREEKGREKSSGVGLPTFYPCPPHTFLRVSVCLILNGCPWLIGLPRSPVTPRRGGEESHGTQATLGSLETSSPRRVSYWRVGPGPCSGDRKTCSDVLTAETTLLFRAPHLATALNWALEAK